jgi:hypothetical protein
MNLRLAVWLLVETFVCPHIEGHATALALETLLVPYLEQCILIYNNICTGARIYDRENTNF